MEHPDFFDRFELREVDQTPCIMVGWKRLGGTAVRQLKKAYLELTNVCNLDCVFCPGTRRAKGFLSPEDFQRYGEKLRPHTKYLYLHLMGEPLLHPQLEDILKRAADLRFCVMVTTNGTLLDRRGALLWNSPAVKKVSISLHSFEGSGTQGGIAGYLDTCVRFALRAAEEGKRCALRLWNRDGKDTRGVNSLNGTVLTELERAFPRPWKEGRRGTTLAPRIFLEWGERFDWPDLSAPEGDSPSFCYGLRDQVGVPPGPGDLQRFFSGTGPGAPVPAVWICQAISPLAACRAGKERKVMEKGAKIQKQQGTYWQNDQKSCR